MKIFQIWTYKMLRYQPLEGGCFTIHSIKLLLKLTLVLLLCVLSVLRMW